MTRPNGKTATGRRPSTVAEPDGWLGDGRVAVVTGSSSGIGAATARALAANGMKVVLNSVTSVDAGEHLACSLPRATYVQGDIADPDACERIVEAAMDTYGRLDVLVNNAATTAVIDHRDVDAVTHDLFEGILRTNVLGTWNTTRAALPHLRASGAGAVVNITSVAALRAGGSSIPYAVSKAALNHMTVLLANACGPDVRVNAVAPGFVQTPWTADWGGTLWPKLRKIVPLDRPGQPEDVAQAVIAAIACEYMTGQVLVVDGGMTLR